jgi:predicted TIM-barrel fold metal-dependent hydrolase
MNPVIDIHTHTFNADDLPVKGFLEARGVPEFIAAIVDAWIQEQTPADPAGAESAVAGDKGLDITDEEAEEILERILRKDPALRRMFEDAMKGESGMDRGLSRSVFHQIVGHLRWAKLITRKREEIAGKMTAIYPEADLFVPLMMDMTYWLDDPIETTFPVQIDLLKRMVIQFEGRVHPFVAFDPERERRFQAGTIDQGAADLVKHAIENCGFLGVKLYPPLGYSPVGRSPSKPQHGQAYRRILWELYDYCAQNEVPVTTHCTDGGAEAHAGSGALADPEGWKTVLADFPQLRLNLAHMGNDKACVDEENQWTQTIAEMMDSYESVYADTGHHCLVENAYVRPRFLDKLEQLFDAYPRAPQRLMFGTDWHLLHRTRTYKKFLVDYCRYYSERFSAEWTEQFMGRNAMAFLGLAPGDRNHERLDRFYEENDIATPSWWQD